SPYSITANIRTDVNEQITWPQDVPPGKHLRVVRRISVDNSRRARTVQICPDNRPFTQVSKGPSAQHPPADLEPGSAEHGPGAFAIIRRMLPDKIYDFLRIRCGRRYRHTEIIGNHTPSYVG